MVIPPGVGDDHRLFKFTDSAQDLAHELRVGVSSRNEPGLSAAISSMPRPCNPSKGHHLVSK